MAGKMNETVKATMNFILEWSEARLKREDIISAEEEILNSINFHLPANHEESYDNVKASGAQEGRLPAHVRPSEKHDLRKKLAKSKTLRPWIKFPQLAKLAKE